MITGKEDLYNTYIENTPENRKAMVAACNQFGVLNADHEVVTEEWVLEYPECNYLEVYCEGLCRVSRLSNISEYSKEISIAYLKYEHPQHTLKEAPHAIVLEGHSYFWCVDEGEDSYVEVCVCNVFSKDDVRYANVTTEDTDIADEDHIFVVPCEELFTQEQSVMKQAVDSVNACIKLCELSSACGERLKELFQVTLKEEGLDELNNLLDVINFK